MDSGTGDVDCIVPLLVFSLKSNYCNNNILDSTMSSRTSNKRKFPNETYFPCAYCSEEVRGRQHAIQCDRPGCDRWQHRSCETQFSAAEYYRMKRGELDVTWYCYRFLTLADPNQEDASLKTLVHSEQRIQSQNHIL